MSERNVQKMRNKKSCTPKKVILIMLALMMALTAVWIFPPNNEIQAGSWSGAFEANLPMARGNMVIAEDNSLWIWGGDRLRPERFMENVADVSTAVRWGQGHTMVIRTDGSLWGWGNNWHGQIGDGTQTTGWGDSFVNNDRVAPVWIMDDVATVVAGRRQTLAIRTDNSLWSWGNNESGQIGDGTQTIRAWGERNGEWVVNEINDRLSPVRVMDNVTQVLSVSTEFSHDNPADTVFAICTDGGLWSWGSNLNGMLGDGTIVDWGASRPAPARILDDVAHVTSNGRSVFAVQTNGTLWAWGSNLRGQLGDGTTTERHRPVRIMDNVVDISVSYNHSMAIRTDGSLWTWGSNTDGQLGDGTQTVSERWSGEFGSGYNILEDNNRHSPVRIMDNVIAVSAGNSHSMAIRNDGSLWAWGCNRSGRIGDGTHTRAEWVTWDNEFSDIEYIIENNNRLTPVQIMDEVIAVSAFANHTIAIRADSSLWAWGSNLNGQLGDGTRTVEEWVGGEWRVTNNDRHSPVQIMSNVMLPGAAEQYEEIIPEYIHEPIPQMQIFTPLPDVLVNVTDPVTAQSAINQTITGLTPEQRISGDAINMATLQVENIMRRGTTQIVSGDINLDAALLQGMTDTAHELHQSTSDILVSEDIAFMRGLRTNVNIISDEQEAVSITFPDDVQGIEFDNVTVEADFAAVTVNRDFIESDSEIGIRRATIEIPSGAETRDGGVTRNVGQNVDRLSDTTDNQGINFLTLLINFWSALAVGLILLTWFLLARSGRKFRLWVVPTFVTVVVAANMFTFLTLGGDDGNAYTVDAIFEYPAQETAREIIFTDAVEVTMTEGMRATLSMPVNGHDPEFLVLVNENNEIQHSRFNPITETIDGRIRESGVYTLHENIVSFADIDDKSILMQDAILRLASRGIMRGTVDGYFFPDDPITRTELVSTIVMAFDMLDFTARTTFIDISPDDWYFPAIATAQQEGIIAGFHDNTFRGNLEIPKDQMVMIAANSLVERMGYQIPYEIEIILAVFLDRDEISGWAEGGIALSTKTNVLIHRADGLFAPRSTMTRGDAAIVLYRVFNRVW